MAEWETAHTQGGWESPKPSLFSQATKPLRDIPGDIASEFGKGSQQIKDTYGASMDALGKGEDKPDGTAMKYLEGGFQELFSPITGTAKALVGDPLRANLPNNTVGKIAAQTGEDFASMAGPSAVGRSLGAVSKAMPGYHKAVKTLMDEGVQMTPGQIAQGIFKRGEDIVKSVPVLGSFIRNSERKSLESFNTAVVNRALKPIGESVPKSVEPGRETIAYAENKIGQKYDKLLPKLTFVSDPALELDVKDILAKNATMAPDQKQQLIGVIDDAKSRLGKNGMAAGAADGHTYKDIESELNYMSRGYLRSDDPDKHRLGEAITDLRTSMRDALERSNPKYKDELQKINASWAAFVRAQGASIQRAKSGGVFSPGDLLQAIKKSSTKSTFARGDGLLQDLAEAANHVLPSTVPDSGTVERGMWGAGLGGLYALKPELAAGAAAASLPYTGPGMKAVNSLARSFPFSNSAKGVQSSAPLTGPAAALINQLMSNENQQ